MTISSAATVHDMKKKKNGALIRPSRANHWDFCWHRRTEKISTSIELNCGLWEREIEREKKTYKKYSTSPTREKRYKVKKKDSHCHRENPLEYLIKYIVSFLLLQSICVSLSVMHRCYYCLFSLTWKLWQVWIYTCTYIQSYSYIYRNLSVRKYVKNIHMMCFKSFHILLYMDEKLIQ